MAGTVRQASAGDAAAWVELLKACLGDEYPAKDVYDPAWVGRQLDPASGSETFVVGSGGRLQCAITILKPVDATNNPVANLGRNLFRPESYNDGSAMLLLQRITELGEARGQMIVIRVPATDMAQQKLCEDAGYKCVGFQPHKHILRTRQGVLFYVHSATPVLVSRQPISDSLPQVCELATKVLESFNVPQPLTVRDGATGYPLQSSDLRIIEASFDDFVLWQQQARAEHPFVEISTGYNRGAGFLRLNDSCPFRAYLGQRGDKMVCGLAYFFDEHDRCVRVLDSFSTDDLSIGAVFQNAVRKAQEVMSAAYLEVDVLASATRLLKSAEQLGFVPIAYFPGFFTLDNRQTDVIKLVKLNMLYTPETASLTPHALAIAKIVDQNFQDQKMGIAIINLLRGLPIFEGLGDGELRKIARLFTQKLFRPGERIFNKGDAGNEAYVVMRGQVDIALSEESKPIATINSGQIFGELAFLDGAPRTAMAIAAQPSILLVVQRIAFMELVQREPHLGMVVMRNIAMDLSNKLRKANAAISQSKK